LSGCATSLHLIKSQILLKFGAFHKENPFYSSWLLMNKAIRKTSLAKESLSKKRTTIARPVKKKTTPKAREKL